MNDDLNDLQKEKERVSGTVKWFGSDLGYGFIEREGQEGRDDKDIFVHYSEIQTEGFKTLSEDDLVTFIIEETERGSVAKRVELKKEKYDDIQ